MKLIVIEENDIEIVCLFEDNEPEQMGEVDVERKKRLVIRKNNFFGILFNLFEIFYIWHKQIENQSRKKTKIIL